MRNDEHEARHDAGVTLIEALVVLVLVAAASAMVAAYRFPLSPTAEVQLALDDLASRLKSARASAIGAGAPVNVVFDLERRHYRVDGKVIALPKDSRITLTSAKMRGGDHSVPQITFFPDGSSSGAQVILEAGAYRRRLVVDWLVGSVRIAEEP